ncbi:Cysteine-rich receptor-like protein kinase 25 [Ananas comosus]|uniref:Cysteine-rich receptor-like protein kinase 25 n=1 Tax=Ananas comosus TaxID=4615 RepID=A0A199UZM8_ANACO|nr:Cysteine-rich receptor-like protein kinase 25 [Ananas comosus]
MDTTPSSALSSSYLLLISLLCCLPLLLHGGDDDSPLDQTCGDTGNYTANSTYESNLSQLLHTLSSVASVSDGFSNASTGESLDQVFGLALCRGDNNATDCRTCLDGASNDTQQLCPYHKEAVIWYDDCLLKYSNQNFTSAFDNSEQAVLYNINNITGERFPGYTQNTTIKNFFNQVVNTLLSDVADSAASNSNSGKLFATGELTITNGFPTIYGLAQCAPDMPGTECRQCLQAEINETLNYFDGRIGGRVLGIWCNLRYEVYPFYYGRSMVSASSVAPGDLPGTPQPPSTRPGSSPSLTVSPPPQIPMESNEHTVGTRRGKSKLRIIIITICLTVLLISCSLLCLLCIKRRRAERAKLYHSRPTFNFDTDEVIRLWKSEENSSEFSLFDFATLVNSTNNFSIESKLGEGGFGPVYKGQLSNGLEIAVKRLSTRSGQGLVEFKNEIQLIAKLQHRNLAWEVWKEGSWLELIDPSLDGSSETYEILRCIHVALMCVQENAADRPTMSDVIVMLNSDSTSLPDPKQPAYFNVRIKDEAEMASDFIVPVSENEITFTSLGGR